MSFYSILVYMAHIPLPALLNRGKNVLIMVILMIILVMCVLQWIVASRYQNFLDNQQGLSQQLLRGVANEIQQYIYHSRQLADILVADHKSLIQEVAGNPDNPVSFIQFNQIIKQFFPEAFNYTIANARGTPLMHLVNKFIGKGCRSDIKGFSQGNHLNEIFIHSNPEPKLYHFDVLAEIDDIGDGEKGIFFVSLDTRNLQRLLKNGEPSNHQLFIIREEAKQTLIEMTSEGIQTTLKRDKLLQEGEIKNIIAAVEIAGTRWRLIDILAPEFKNQVYYELQRDALIITMTLLLFSIAFIIIALMHERKRFVIELEIQTLNESLENCVEKRTKDLHNSQMELSFQAIHDQLTGLINRREFERRLEGLIIKTKTDSIESIIMYMDLDQFKVVNDTAGHNAGDELLRQIASLLHNEIRSTDTLARLGGDEFGILLESCPISKAKTIAKQLHNDVNSYTFKWADCTYRVGLSIGIMIIDADTADITEVMSNVDASCYTAKAKGRNSIYVYTPNDSQLQTHRNQMFWATEAIQAIESDRMELFCQLINPINADEQPPWYEILVRIRDKQGELVFPDTFIPALECYGGIEKLDLAVLSRATKFMLAHQELRFNINISGASISNRQFHNQVVNILNEPDINPTQIVFEITETAIVSNLSIAREFIAMMKNLGCSIALDDFGSGMSSFAFLNSLDIDYIKLDGAFVKDIHEDPVHHSMVNAINSVAQVMGKQTIAEFVENKEVSALLKDIGISNGQGYFYHYPAPLTADTLESLVGLTR